MKDPRLTAKVMVDPTTWTIIGALTGNGVVSAGLVKPSFLLFFLVVRFLKFF